MSDRLTREQEEQIGGHNDWPPNLEEIEPEDWWNMFFAFGYDWQMLSRQPLVDPENGLTSGFHILRVFVTNPRSPMPEGYVIETQNINAKRVPKRFYKFHTCDHEFKGYSTRRGYHDYRCSECGQRETWDSGD